MNNDGEIDLIAASYAGNAYIFWGENGKLKAPEVLRYDNGEEINMGTYWNYKEKKWKCRIKELIDSGNYNEKELEVLKKRSYKSAGMTFIHAVDWDNDGDLDLILNAQPKTVGSSSAKPRVLINKGSKQKYKFNEEYFVIDDMKNYHYTDATVDWDGDGLWDIIAGSKGKSIAFYKNIGSKNKPRFAEPKMLFNDSKLQNNEYYELGISQPSICDYNGDGKLDLIVGNTFYAIKQNANETGNNNIIIAFKKQLNDLRKPLEEMHKNLLKSGVSEEEATKILLSSDEYKNQRIKANEIIAKMRATGIGQPSRAFIYKLINKEK